MKIEKFNNTVFGELKTIELDGEIWFVGKQVATLLQYSDTTQAIRDLCEDATPLNKFGGCIIDNCEKIKSDLNLKGNSAGQSRLITESDLYSLSFSSKLPKAKEFRKWVTKTVLPSLRKHGSYVVGQEHLTQEAFDELNNRLSEFSSQLQHVSARDSFKGKKLLEMNRKLQLAYGQVELTKDGRLGISIDDYAKNINIQLKSSRFVIGRNEIFKILRDELGYISYKRRGNSQQIVSEGELLSDGSVYSEYFIDHEFRAGNPTRIYVTQAGVDELTQQIVEVAFKHSRRLYDHDLFERVTTLLAKFELSLELPPSEKSIENMLLEEKYGDKDPYT